MKPLRRDGKIAGKWLLFSAIGMGVFCQVTSGQSSDIAQTEPRTFWAAYSEACDDLRRDDFENALANFEEALEIEPGHTATIVQIARLHLKLEQFDEAEDMSRIAISSDSANAGAHLIHARVMHSIGRNAEAIAAYKKSIELDAKNAYAHNNLGLLYIELGHYVDAVAELHKATQLKNDVAFFFNNLGVAYERIKQFDKARDSFETALEIDSSHSKSRANLLRLEKNLQKHLSMNGSCC